ncbi:MAG: type IX secretion system membrane protein PorP/SprF [Flavobacteriales bacterium]|nr:type IX secretion system membrane protein PorP/SprF [Flavobacteriales bacterium]
MKKIFGLFIVTIMALGGQCQEFTFIQPLGIEIFNNPGFTSSYSNWLKSSYRISNQGLASENTQHTTGYWHRFSKIKSNIGVAYTQSKATESGNKMTRVDLNYAYEWKLTRKISLCPGFSGALINTDGAVKSQYYDVSGGVVLKRKDKLKVGYALHHYNQPEYDVTNLVKATLVQRHNVFAIYQKKLNYKSRIAAFANLNWKNGEGTHYYGLLAQRKFILIGAGLDKDLHYMAMVRLRLRALTIRYSYDAVKSTLTNENMPSHEFGLDLKMPHRISPLRLEAIRMPNF